MASVSHEFNTPLNAILNTTDNLLANLTNPLDIKKCKIVRFSAT